jgi:hypothetical protein
MAAKIGQQRDGRRHNFLLFLRHAIVNALPAALTVAAAFRSPFCPAPTHT